MIAFRKAHGALRLTTPQDVSEAVAPVEGLDANETETTVSLPEGSWNVYVNAEKAGTEILDTISEGSAMVSPISAMVLVRENGAAAASDETADAANVDAASPADQQTEAGSNGIVALIIGIAAAVLIACGVVVWRHKK